MARVLAIDFGVKRCGIAVCDPLCIIANPVDTIETAKIFNFFETFFKTHEVDTLVLGKPMQMNGNPSQCWDNIQLFAKKFEETYPNIQIKFQDERFTSKIASAAIAQSGMPKYKRESKALIDKTSAIIILQSYLDQK